VGLSASSYYVRFTDLPERNAFTFYNEGTPENNSNVLLPLPTDGKTDLFTLAGAQINLTIDAGLIGPDNSTLPADGLKLSAKYSNSIVSLNWETLSEFNTSRFEIERSSNNGINFSKIAVTRAAGNAQAISNYSLIDVDAVNQPSGILLYRVKLIDEDGSFKYSNVVVIRISTTGIKVWPNPFVEKVQVSVNSASAGTVQMRITDVTGKTVYNKATTVNKGVNQFNITQLGSLPSGNYVLEIINSNEQTKSSFILTRN
jgi:hypothetical protein